MNLFLTAALAATLGLPGPPTPAPASEWSQTGYGPGATYYNPHERRLTPASVDGIKRRWDIPTHADPECEVGREPLVGGDHLYTSDPGGVGAYDPATGKRRWHADLHGRGVMRIAMSDGILAVLSYACTGQRNFLTAYRASSGSRLWELPLGAPSQDMIIDEGVVVVDVRPDFGASTIAHRLATGARLWRLGGTRADGLLSAGGRLLLRQEGQGSRAVQITTGATIWETKENWYAVGSDPAGTRFYVSSHNVGLTAVDAADGRKIWESTWHPSGVTADERYLYFPWNHSIYCVDAGNGRKLWSVPLEDGAGQPVRAGALLYSPAGIGAKLSIVEAETGKPRKGGMPSDESHPPVVADGRLFLTDGNRLRAYF
ncbi:hypothetical protein Aca07nite_04980 [Actinoplanes capillaceus]|uniref:Pyrrolo-quinoline quinone repeat domain-containing protein n=1 Tax=Actinoplanes campanulatus TaxID=113559 RepID=A0ABQ3WAM1_9ACTN|nr:PQQ-like beta-propeller repeat protein [Actinoplanes capillaceus]GID43223.1 hypothetical protein Aca07nite_04980 [Actinoplanes capillaceus]